MGLNKMEKKNKKLRERLNEIRGKILSDSIEIEDNLTFRIFSFFYPKQNRKGTAFYWHILNTHKFRFNDKIRLFEQIPYFKKLKTYDSIMISLKFVRRLRNQLAHWELLENKSKLDHIVLQDPVKVERVIINDKLLEEFDKHKELLSRLLPYKHW